ncbi:nuclear transport factor 2 family protein [Nocardia sp. NPDC048505]|uniref:nuclear transport factor 2 family protein n=1 Tax=Nocardia sp. NPDC048505 TaxID=3155756 RepID=UPI0033EB8B3F
MNEIVSQYLETWNTTDPTTRHAAITRLFTPNATYTDPMAAVTGHTELDATIAAVQTQFPDWTFRLAGPIDAHHNQVRFTWTLSPTNGPALIVGFDVAVITDGKISAVYGFLDKVPATA